MNSYKKTNIQNISLLTNFADEQRCNFEKVSNIQKLPTIEALMQNTIISNDANSLDKTIIVYIHHPLQTSVNIIEAMIRLGAKPDNIHVLGKKYSECSVVVEQFINLGVQYHQASGQIGTGKFTISFIRDVNWLWLNVLNTLNLDNDIKQILVLDHGGWALTYIPPAVINKYKIIGIEKTTAGLINLEKNGMPPFPVISVANCAAKKIFESPLIAEAVINKIIPLISFENKNIICGVVGYGSIGKAIVKKLLSMNHKVILFDNDLSQIKQSHLTNQLQVAESISDLINLSDYIFGCTGQDISTSTDFFQQSSKDKILISCSSEDKEFYSLLRLTQQKKQETKEFNSFEKFNPFENLIYITEKGAHITILKGGFPANFNNSGESVPKNDIQLTRALVLGSVLQAIQYFKNEFVKDSVLCALDPKLQEFVVNEWLKYQPPSRFCYKTINKFKNLKWIIENSGGKHHPVDILHEIH